MFLGCIVGRRMGCRKVVHRLSGSAGHPFGSVVLSPPGLALEDLGEDRGVVVGLPWRQHTPDKAWLTVGGQDVGGAPARVDDLHPDFLQDLADHGGPVGAVDLQGLAGPFPADQDPAPAEAEVLTVVGLGRA